MLVSDEPFWHAIIVSLFVTEIAIPGPKSETWGTRIGDLFQTWATRIGDLFQTWATRHC